MPGRVPGAKTRFWQRVTRPSPGVGPATINMPLGLVAMSLLDRRYPEGRTSQACKPFDARLDGILILESGCGQRRLLRKSRLSALNEVAAGSPLTPSAMSAPPADNPPLASVATRGICSHHVAPKVWAGSSRLHCRRADPGLIWSIATRAAGNLSAAVARRITADSHYDTNLTFATVTCARHW